MRHSPESKLISDHSAHRSGQCLRLQRQPLFRDLFERLSLRTFSAFRSTLGSTPSATNRRASSRRARACFNDTFRIDTKRDAALLSVMTIFQSPLANNFNGFSAAFAEPISTSASGIFQLPPTGGEPSSYSRSYPRARQAVNGQPKSAVERKSLFLKSFVEARGLYWMSTEGKMVPAAGVEPATHGLQNRCSTN